jgi:hypothetical protein
MGKTAFSGPLYGAKSLLWHAHRDNQLPAANDTTTVTVASIRVPAYEQWLITEFKGFRGSSGSTGVTTTWNLTDDSAVIASLATTSSAAGVMLSTTPTPTAGEYEGVLVDANSTLAWTIGHGGSSAAVSSDVSMWAYGYIRFLSSTRAEA